MCVFFLLLVEFLNDTREVDDNKRRAAITDENAARRTDANISNECVSFASRRIATLHAVAGKSDDA